MDLLDGVGLEDPILGDDGFEDGSLENFGFVGDFIGVFTSGGDVMLEDVIFEAVDGVGVGFEGAVFGTVSI